MKRIYVRPTGPGDTEQFIQWAVANKANEFDPAVAAFPSSVTWCAYDEDGPLVYQTLQRPLFLESVAPRPGATKSQTAAALRELTQNAITLAHIAGAGEIYFLGSDDDTNEFAAGKIFELVPYKVYRVKLADLEGPDENNTTR